MRLWWGPEESDGAAFDSVDAHMSRLHELDDESCARAIMVDVFSDDDSVVSVGLGAPFSVLTYMSADQDPPYLTSRSVPPLRDSTAWFDYGGSETEVRADALIHKDAAFALVGEFLQRGDISSVAWEEE